MRRFAALYDRLDRTNSTNDKVAAIVAYLAAAPAADAAWAVFFLSGERLPAPVKVREMTEWACDVCGVDAATFEVCYEEVGDRAETLALLLEAAPGRRDEGTWDPPLREVVELVVGLRSQDPAAQRAALTARWAQLALRELFVLNKVITGGFRVGVSKRLLVRALSQWSGIDTAVLFHRMMGAPIDSEARFRGLFDADSTDADRARPYPFFLASPVEGEVATLGEVADWQAEWKWDGIRGQLVARGGEVSLWSRGEELVTDSFPDIAGAAVGLPDGVVLDGEILAWRDGAPLPFASLQRRLGRKRVGKKTLADYPCTFLCYDLLEEGGADLRAAPLRARRARLEATAALVGFPVSEVVDAESWGALARLREQSRGRGVEGMMLKRLDSPYRTGRVRGDWWKWKVDPLELDAVLVYAQPGHGRRAGLHTDYTFAVWSEGELVPVAKAYTGLDNAEIRELDTWIRRNTTDKFGPVRQVAAEHVFELHFDSAQRSTRHKSGVALRFPRIARWRREREPQSANRLDDVLAMVGEPSGD